MADLEANLQTLVLSAHEIKKLTDWPDAMIEDYLTILRNLVTVASEVDSSDSRIEQNELNIATNATNISTNSTDISTNATNITTNATNLTNHESDTSAHGVTGDNVGTSDFASVGTGGVVNLAALVSNAVASTVSVTSPDASAAPALYSQTQVQEIVTLANEMKGDVNTLVTDVNNAITQLNDLFSKMKTAKQMSTI